MTRVWNTPIFIIATVYFIVDGVFSYVTRPITVWIGKKKLLKRVRLMGWSGRAPAPPAIEAGKGCQRRGARHVSAEHPGCRCRHRYR